MGLIRFDRDVLAQPNVSAVIALIGINDIGQAAKGQADYASAEEIEAGLTKLVERAHQRGVKIYLGTLAPFKGAKDGYYTEEKEALRQAVNGWIRESSRCQNSCHQNQRQRRARWWSHPGRLLGWSGRCPNCAGCEAQRSRSRLHW